MIPLRAELEVRQQQPSIRYPEAVFLSGPCFTEHMGERIGSYRLPVLQNPHGILFNPVSIGDSLLSLVQEKRYEAEDLFYLHERWNSWDHHGRFSNPDQDACLEQINASQVSGSAFLRRADWLILTLGSAWVYVLKSTGRVVANCHKAPADWFQHRLLTLEEVLSVFDNLLHRLFLLRPGLRVVFTVSPVRHLREGMIENNRSKAVLIQAVHHLVDKFSGLAYFPAYELIVDDLRDYRFYAEDLVHPNHLATQYVWEKFVAGFMSPQAREVMQAMEPIIAARRHRPFNALSEEHRRFWARMREQCLALQEKYPFLDLSEDIKYFS